MPPFKAGAQGALNWLQVLLTTDAGPQQIRPMDGPANCPQVVEPMRICHKSSEARSSRMQQGLVVRQGCKYCCNMGLM